jgi:hypothetical protein
LRRSIDRQELPQKDRAGPARPVHTVGVGAGSIRSRSDLCGEIGIHDQQAPQNRFRDLLLLRPIYLAVQRPATDPRGWPRGSSPGSQPKFLELGVIAPGHSEATSSWCYTAAVHGSARRTSRIFAGRTSACGTISLLQLKTAGGRSDLLRARLRFPCDHRRRPRVAIRAAQPRNRPFPRGTSLNKRVGSVDLGDSLWSL